MGTVISVPSAQGFWKSNASPRQPGWNTWSCSLGGRGLTFRSPTGLMVSSLEPSLCSLTCHPVEPNIARLKGSCWVPRVARPAEPPMWELQPPDAIFQCIRNHALFIQTHSRMLALPKRVHTAKEVFILFQNPCLTLESPRMVWKHVLITIITLLLLSMKEKPESF